MLWKKGWIENRRSGAGTIHQLVDYNILRGDDFQYLTSSPHYSHTGLSHGAVAQVMAKLLNCGAPDLFNGVIMVCGPDPIQRGHHLEVQMHLSHYNCKLKFLAKAVTVQMAAEMKEMVFSAGVKILAAHKADVELLNRIIEKQKPQGSK